MTGTSGDLGVLDPRPAPPPPNMTVFIAGPGQPILLTVGFLIVFRTIKKILAFIGSYKIKTKYNLNYLNIEISIKSIETYSGD